MENFSHAFYLSQPDWFSKKHQTSKTTVWTPEENKTFEDGLAIFDEGTPHRWFNIAAMVPGKTVTDVIKQYKELEIDVGNIEAGLVPIPVYENRAISYQFDSVTDQNKIYGFDKDCWLGRSKGSLYAEHHEYEKKRGVPWSEEEHKFFLMGLGKYGRGDWKHISRNYVKTRTPSQVASHAQKFYIRQRVGKHKRRPSIHDITTTDLDASLVPPENKTNVSSSGLQKDFGFMSRPNMIPDSTFGNDFVFNCPTELFGCYDPGGIDSLFGCYVPGAIDSSYGSQEMPFQASEGNPYFYG